MESTSGRSIWSKKLPGVGREGFDVPTLAFRIDRVECQRGLAGTAQAGNHRERVARNLDVDVLEIVLACAVDGNTVKH
jgi:hypothetical protein